MKLLFCTKCQDIIKLAPAESSVRTCMCGKSSGRYINEIDAMIYGPCIPLGFANNSLAQALAHRPASGDGVLFNAFVIPNHCPTLVHAASVLDCRPRPSTSKKKEAKHGKKDKACKPKKSR